MKKKLSLILICSLLLFTLSLSACNAREAGSLKALTRPYIAHYECTEATLGGEDILDGFDYIEIVLLNKEDMQLIYKPKDGKKQIYESGYSFNTDTRELTADIGIYGYRFKQSAVIEHGKFTVLQTLGGKQLIMKFKAK